MSVCGNYWITYNDWISDKTTDCDCGDSNLYYKFGVYAERSETDIKNVHKYVCGSAYCYDFSFNMYSKLEYGSEF